MGRPSRSLSASVPAPIPPLDYSAPFPPLGYAPVPDESLPWPWDDASPYYSSAAAGGTPVVLPYSPGPPPSSTLTGLLVVGLLALFGVVFLASTFAAFAIWMRGLSVHRGSAPSPSPAGGGAGGTPAGTGTGQGGQVQTPDTAPLDHWATLGTMRAAAGRGPPWGGLPHDLIRLLPQEVYRETPCLDPGERKEASWGMSKKGETPAKLLAAPDQGGGEGAANLAPRGGCCDSEVGRRQGSHGGPGGSAKEVEEEAKLFLCAASEKSTSHPAASIDRGRAEDAPVGLGAQHLWGQQQHQQQQQQQPSPPSSSSSSSSLSLLASGRQGNPTPFPLDAARRKPGASRECPVCLGEYEDGEVVRWLPECGHAFHGACIEAWLASRSTCPLCRLPVGRNLALWPRLGGDSGVGLNQINSR